MNKVYINILVFIIFLIVSCSEKNTSKESIVILDKAYSMYDVSINVYSYEIDKVLERSYIQGIITIDCHSCISGELYDFSNISLCVDGIRSTLMLKNDTIASVFPSIIFKKNKKIYEISTTWSFENKLPKSINNLIIC